MGVNHPHCRVETALTVDKAEAEGPGQAAAAQWVKDDNLHRVVALRVASGNT